MKLKVLRVHNHGDVDEEYVLLRVTEDCDLKRYAIYDCTYTEEHRISNKNRHFYRWHPRDAKKGELVSLRTGSGKNAIVTNSEGERVHRFYWGLKSPVWNDDGDAAVLIEIADWNTTRSESST